MFLSNKKNDKNQDQSLLKGNREDVAKALDILFAKDYISKKRLYYENFLRGIFFGAGSILGATVFIAILLWSLTLFGEIPFIGDFFDTAKENIESNSKTP